MSDATGIADVEHWDAFWRARDKAVTREDAGARDPAPVHFWEAFFREEFARKPGASLLDVACGHGVVTGIAIAAAENCDMDLQAHCADYSQSAVDELQKRFPGVEGVACDAADMPYPDGRFDYVVSQFGIEYAGVAAFGEAGRLVGDGGTFAALTHLAGGAIQAECAENAAVAATLRESRLMPLARQAFEAGFDLIAGKITDAEFQEADRQLAPAVEAAKNLLRAKGPHAAGGLLANLYRDIGHMYTRMQNYVPGEVFAWFDGMSAELDSYEGRMASMTRCALDEAQIASIAEGLTASGFDVEPPRVLSLEESGKPAAWILVARRGA
ncbi:MAG TPA: class I SAM-dependent methyltransferase [Woeseiaceae bacterium]|nr:class I SAM-dependent methyltransferase [Woeseiaceae bacterium]